MGANDSPTTTRSIITDYFDWRLNNRTVTNNRLFLIVRKIASDSEAAYRSQQSTFNFHFSSSSPIDLQTLNNIKDIHNEIAKEMFNDGGITWTRIITLISFSALLAEHVIQQQSNNSSRNLIISSVIDWTTDFIDTELQTWLQSQNYWVRIEKCLFVEIIIMLSCLFFPVWLFETL
jgi:Neuraminidase (sialidase)